MNPIFWLQALYSKIPVSCDHGAVINNTVNQERMDT